MPWECRRSHPDGDSAHRGGNVPSEDEGDQAEAVSIDLHFICQQK